MVQKKTTLPCYLAMRSHHLGFPLSLFLSYIQISQTKSHPTPQSIQPETKKGRIKKNKKTLIFDGCFKDHYWCLWKVTRGLKFFWMSKSRAERLQWGRGGRSPHPHPLLLLRLQYFIFPTPSPYSSSFPGSNGILSKQDQGRPWYSGTRRGPSRCLRGTLKPTER